MKTLAQPRRLAFALLCAAGLSLSATALHATTLDRDVLRLEGASMHVGNADPYTDGARTVDAYTDGARSVDAYTDGARADHVSDGRDRFGQGA